MKFAMVMDGTINVTEFGYSLSISTYQFITAKRSYNLFDTPGKRKYWKSAIKGAALAETAVMVVSAVDFEKDLETTREHALIAETMGCDQMIVAVNKLDTFAD